MRSVGQREGLPEAIVLRELKKPTHQKGGVTEIFSKACGCAGRAWKSMKEKFSGKPREEESELQKQQGNVEEDATRGTDESFLHLRQVFSSHERVKEISLL